MSGDPVYCYPPLHRVLRNRFDIEDEAALDRIERRLVTQRIAEGIPSGIFDLQHLRAIHRHMFQDVYDWAGELRTVEIAKDGHQFQFRRFMETGMADVHRRIVATDFLKGLSSTDFADRAGAIMGDVNYVHPFREGNGRTQLLYLEQLAAQAGHRLDLTRLDREGWMDASRRAHLGVYAPMAAAIRSAICAPLPERRRTRPRER